MAASLARRVLISQISPFSNRILGCRKVQYSSDHDTSGGDPKQETPTAIGLTKFAQLVEKVEKQNEEKMKIAAVEKDLKVLEIEDEGPQVKESFATMFRKSKLVSMGEYEGRLLQGNIIEVMEDDLYIDFGAKFHCVCPRPKVNGEKYTRGKRVLLQLKALELSSAFLGSDIHVTLLEGDATLRGSNPIRIVEEPPQPSQ